MRAICGLCFFLVHQAITSLFDARARGSVAGDVQIDAKAIELYATLATGGAGDPIVPASGAIFAGMATPGACYYSLVAVLVALVEFPRLSCYAEATKSRLVAHYTRTVWGGGPGSSAGPLVLAAFAPLLRMLDVGDVSGAYYTPVGSNQEFNLDLCACVCTALLPVVGRCVKKTPSSTLPAAALLLAQLPRRAGLRVGRYHYVTD